MIRTYPQFLPFDLFTRLCDNSTRIFTEHSNQFYTNMSWESGIIKDSAPILCHVVDRKDMLDQELITFVEKNLQKTVKFMMYYYYMPMSHIPWHDDNKHNGAMTIYLNSHWDPDNGGLFLYRDKDDIKAVVPEEGLAIYNPKSVLHSVSCTTKDAPIRSTIQLFME